MAKPYDYTKDKGLQHGANKYTTCQELLHGIDGYFETQQKTIIKTEYDKEGNVVETKHAPYTLSGLCLYLGVTRPCLTHWSKSDHPFSDLMQYAKLRITDYIESNLSQGIGTQGEIFRLKNIDSENWKDKQEIDYTNKIKPEEDEMITKIAQSYIEDAQTKQIEIIDFKAVENIES